MYRGNARSPQQQAINPEGKVHQKGFGGCFSVCCLVLEGGGRSRHTGGCRAANVLVGSVLPRRQAIQRRKKHKKHMSPRPAKSMIPLSSPRYGHLAVLCTCACHLRKHLCRVKLTARRHSPSVASPRERCAMGTDQVAVPGCFQTALLGSCCCFGLV